MWCFVYMNGYWVCPVAANFLLQNSKGKGISRGTTEQASRVPLKFDGYTVK